MSNVPLPAIASDVMFTLLVGAVVGTLADWLPAVTLLASLTVPAVAIVRLPAARAWSWG